MTASARCVGERGTKTLLRIRDAVEEWKASSLRRNLLLGGHVRRCRLYRVTTGKVRRQRTSEFRKVVCATHRYSALSIQESTGQNQTYKNTTPHALVVSFLYHSGA